MSELPPGLRTSASSSSARPSARSRQRAAVRSRRRPRVGCARIGLPVAAALAAAAVSAGRCASPIASARSDRTRTAAGGAPRCRRQDPSVVAASAVADPSGGPPWVLRIYTNAAGHDCVKVGRLQDGVFGEVQLGRFRALPPSADGTCSAAVGRRALIAVGVAARSSNLTLVFGLATDRAPVSSVSRERSAGAARPRSGRS